MAVVGGPDEIVTDGLIIHVDVKNKTTLNTQQTIYDLTGTTVFSRAFNSGTTTVDGISYNYVDLANVDENEGCIYFDRKRPAGDISPYYGQGGNFYKSLYDIAWGQDDFTWVVWVNPRQLVDYCTLIDWKYTSVNSAYGISTDGKPFIRYRDTTSPYATTGVTSNIRLAYINTWNYIVVRRQSNMVTFFNGITKSSEQFYDKNWEVGIDITLGWGPDLDARWRGLVGKLGPVMIYDRALSELEIQKNYNSTKERFTNK